MRAVLLGLKEKKTGNYFLYDVANMKKHSPIRLNETKKIAIVDPFPFSNFSSLDKVDEGKFEKCYLEVEADLSDQEFMSMQSSGIVYHRFANRNVTLLNEFFDIFQHSLKMLKSFGKKLGTYDLTTWVMHNETKNEAEFKAMKQIILKAVTDKENKDYPLDISVDEYTLVYMDYFRELSEKGRKITFGRYGTNDRAVFRKTKTTFSNETFLYLMQNVRLFDYSYLEHELFTYEFYESYIKGTTFEEEFFYSIDEKDFVVLKAKGFDFDDFYRNFYELTIKRVASYFPEYNGDFFRIFTDPAFEPYIKTSSPFDYYCCEDCDGYDIYELYSDEELEGKEVLVDERLQYVNDLLRIWGECLSSKSYPLFERFPNDVLENYAHHPFIKQYLALRNANPSQ